MRAPLTLLSLLFPILGTCGVIKQKRGTLPPKFTGKLIGNSTGLYPNSFRDGGGGGKVDGVHLINFSDTLTLTGPEIGDALKGFVSNSITISGYGGGGPEVLHDFGDNGVPKLEVPWFKEETKMAIWPNSNIATTCGGKCGIAFYSAFNRTDDNALMYNTGVNITLDSTGSPVISRPVKSLFGADEVQYGSFAVKTHSDGYLYLFGRATHVAVSGIKMARVPETNPFDRSAYQYWDGDEWSKTAPKLDDGGYANIFNWTFSLNGGHSAPSAGEIFYSNFYGTYMILFQGAGFDRTVWMSYSSSLHTGWSEPVAVYKTPAVVEYNYCIHAYPQFDETQRVIPISFIQHLPNGDNAGSHTGIGWANITFS